MVDDMLQVWNFMKRKQYKSNHEDRLLRHLENLIWKITECTPIQNSMQMTSAQQFEWFEQMTQRNIYLMFLFLNSVNTFVI